MKQFLTEHYLQFIGKRYAGSDIGALSTFLEVIGVLKNMNCGMDAYFQKLGISQARFKMMLNLLYNDDEGGLSPALLADALGVKRATITGLLDTLENDLWIERHPDPNDRRGLLIKITEAGKLKLDSVLPAHYERISLAMGHLTAKEQEHLKVLIRKFGRGMEAMEAVDLAVEDHGNDRKTKKESDQDQE
ncbi:MAG: MarR family transcriptional regulator [Oligoflexus sp.]|nr:MarR family transcriptional regulator [Oligoflexus sp.]